MILPSAASTNGAPSPWHRSDAIGRADLSATAKGILRVIASHVNAQTGVAWLTQCRIAEQTGYRVRTVRRNIKDLERRGLLIVRRPGPRQCHQYVIAWDRLAAGPAETRRGDTLSPIAHGMADTDDADRGQARPPIGDSGDPDRGHRVPPTIEVHGRKTEEEQDHADFVILSYPTAGQPATWHLRGRKLEEWSAAYPGLDVVAVCQRALQWLREHPKGQRAAADMTGWLSTTWLAREWERTKQQRRRDGTDDRYRINGQTALQALARQEERIAANPMTQEQLALLENWKVPSRTGR